MAMLHPIPPPALPNINQLSEAGLPSPKPAVLKHFTSPASRLLISLPLRHLPFLLILLLHLALSITYSRQVPLGEAPDEPAHLAYAQFIAHNGRLPATLAERREAGYRSTWPPLYHFLVAGPLAMIGDAPPTRLKAVGDTPRRLIPTNGQTIAAFIHTADETPPWRGLPLAWHLSRFVSIALTAVAVVLTYVIARRLTGQQTLAYSAAALHAFMPQLLFIGAVLNDDNLLICLSGLIFLLLISYPPRPSRGHAFFLGALLGLATVAKYNALPLWALVIMWGVSRGRQTGRPDDNSFHVNLLPRHASILSFVAGAVLGGGWWFSYIWFYFNQIDRLGLLPGSLAALSAGASDASIRQLTSGSSAVFPSAAAWLEWFITLFETFWGSFGGGSTIDLPAWAYGLLALLGLLAIISGVAGYVLRVTYDVSPTSLHPILLLLSPLFFLPLPLLRFILTGSIVETAQGRHLFPALPAIALGLVWGLACLPYLISHIPELSRPLGRIRANGPLVAHHTLPIILPFFTLCLSLYALILISASYPPPIPLRTTPDAVAANHLVNIKVAEGVILAGFEVGQADLDLLPLTLIWQASATPPDDYLIELTLTDETNQPVGGWLGHPLGGRYPTRAWDKGDVLRQTIPIPVVPNQSTPAVTLTVRLLDSFDQPTTPTPITLLTDFSLPAARPGVPRSPAQLRADELPPNASFTYRSTVSFALPNAIPPQLTAPTGQIFSPNYFIAGTHASIAHFIVAVNWPSGNYQVSISNTQRAESPVGADAPLPSPIPITNRPRQFDPPSMEHTLNANFANTVTLLGYDLPQQRVQPGHPFPVTLYWRAERSLGQNLIVFNHLLDQTANQRGGADRVPQLYYTTLLWVPGEIVADSYQVPVDAAAPPGVYWLDVGLYPSEQPTFSLPLFDNGRPIQSNSVRLGPLKVGGPPPDITVPVAQPQQPLNLSFSNQITLLGFTLMDKDENPVHQSGSKRAHRQLILFWQVNSPPTADYTIFVHLLDTAGNLAAQFDGPPAAGAYPTSLWEPGEIIADERSLTDLLPGRYVLYVGLYRPDSGERLAVAGAPDGAVKLAEVEVGE